MSERASERIASLKAKMGGSADLEVAQHLRSSWLEVQLHGKLEIVVN